MGESEAGAHLCIFQKWKCLVCSVSEMFPLGSAMYHLKESVEYMHKEYFSTIKRRKISHLWQNVWNIKINLRNNLEEKILKDVNVKT